MDCELKNKVVILGANHHTTLAAVRSLGEKKADVYAVLVKGPMSFVESSKYLKHGRVTFVNDINEIPTLLLKLFADEEKKVVIVTCSDAIAVVIDDSKDLLCKSFIMSGTSDGCESIKTLMNKDYLCEVANGVGVLVPQSWSIKLDESETIQNVISYPCLCKPLASYEGSPVGGTYAICKDSHELNEVINKYRKAGFVSLLAEEYIDTDVEVFLEGCAYGKGQKPYIPAAFIKEKAYKENNGSTTLGLMVKDYTQYIDVKLVNEFCERIGYSGVFDFEYRINAKGAYLIDANLRVGGCTYGLTRIGANIIYSWCLYVAQGKKDENYSIMSNVHYINEFFYLHDIKRGAIGVKEILADMFKKKAYAVGRITDPIPFVKRFFRRR